MAEKPNSRLRTVEQVSGEALLVETPVKLARLPDFELGPGFSDNPHFCAVPSATDLVRRFRISDAVVDGSFRLLFKDNFVIEEALFGIPDDEISNAPKPSPMPFPFSKDKVVVLGFTWTAINYYHWLTQVLTSLEACLTSRYLNDVILAVPELKDWQVQTLKLLGYHDIPRLTISNGQQFAIPQLEFADFINNPIRMSRLAPSVYKRLKLGVRLSSKGGSRLYVSRQDATFRCIINEAEVMKVMEAHGFRIICAGKMPLEERLDCFHNASIVVGPHGTGLTDVAFCNEGTVLYELIPRNYRSLGITNIARNCGLRYMADLFDQEVGADSPQVTDFTVDIDVLQNRLRSIGI